MIKREMRLIRIGRKGRGRTWKEGSTVKGDKGSGKEKN